MPWWNSFIGKGPRSSTCAGPFFYLTLWDLWYLTHNTNKVILSKMSKADMPGLSLLWHGRQHHSDLICNPALLAGFTDILFKVFLLTANVKNQLWTNTVRKCFVFREATSVETPKPASTLTCSLGFLIINHEASGQREERWWKVDGQSSQTHGVFLSTSVIWCSISQASLC